MQRGVRLEGRQPVLQQISYKLVVTHERTGHNVPVCVCVCVYVCVFACACANAWGTMSLCVRVWLRGCVSGFVCERACVNVHARGVTSLYVTVSLCVMCHYISLYVTVCHCMSLYVTVCHCMSLYVTKCHCLKLSVTMFVQLICGDALWHKPSLRTMYKTDEFIQLYAQCTQTHMHMQRSPLPSEHRHSHNILPSSHPQFHSTTHTGSRMCTPLNKHAYATHLQITTPSIPMHSAPAPALAPTPTPTPTPAPTQTLI